MMTTSNVHESRELINDMTIDLLANLHGRNRRIDGVISRYSDDIVFHAGNISLGSALRSDEHYKKESEKLFPENDLETITRELAIDVGSLVVDEISDDVRFADFLYRSKNNLKVPEADKKTSMDSFLRSDWAPDYAQRFTEAKQLGLTKEITEAMK